MPTFQSFFTACTVFEAVLSIAFAANGSALEAQIVFVFRWQDDQSLYAHFFHRRLYVNSASWFRQAGYYDCGVDTYRSTSVGSVRPKKFG